MISFDWWSLTFIVYLLGWVLALDAIWQGRTAQSSIAWSLSLILLPMIGMPLYLLFGTRKFHGYRQARRQGDAHLNTLGQTIRHHLQPFARAADNTTLPLYNFFRLPMTRSNRCQLLIDGEHTFAAMHRAIEQAQHSVCVQFYIVQDDASGQAMADLLIRRANDGLRIYFLYDEIGSHQLSRRYLNKLRDGGVRVSRFNSWQFRHRLQLNFRNHRKLLVVDGQQAFVGGINLGDEYLANGPAGRWRDTHVAISGPAALPFQLSFCEDWNWATQYMPQLQWLPTPATAQTPEADKSQVTDCDVMCINSGPADQQESASLSLTHLLHQAQHRIWLATPYFVPDIPTLAALRLAAARGLDVRILVPRTTDKWFVQHAMQSYIDELSRAGIRFYHYLPGFMHQKVMLIDKNLSSIGSANIDNRSLRINFEANALIRSSDFAKQVETMLQADFGNAAVVVPESRFSKRLLNKIIRLSAPVL